MKHPLRNLARQLRSNMTDTERFVWQRIRKKQFAGHRFRRQHPLGPFIVDFVCLEARLVLEFDGGQHAIRREEDAARTRWLEEQGFRVLRFWDSDVFKEWDGVETVIIKALESARLSPHPALPPQSLGEGKTVPTASPSSHGLE
jgi:very-short-patch-repair endonuclease